MDYRAFEQRLLETIFTTDVQLTPATIAYLYKLSVQDAADLLQQAAVHGLLNIESDDEGNLLYTYPNRTKLRREAAQGPAQEGRDLQQLALARRDPMALDHPGPASGVVPGVPIHPGYNDPPRPPSGEPGADAGASASAAAAPQSRCPFCGETILLGAKKCRHCHEYLDYALRDIQSLKTPGALVHIHREPLVPMTPGGLVPFNGLPPALLSLFLPGLGQIWRGQVAAGLLWMMFTFIGYIPLVIPGFILHILCIINAAKQPRQLT